VGSLGTRQRNYPDPNHKPELICALTEFHALVGFRDPLRTVELLAALDSPPLQPYRTLLAAAPDATGLRTVFTTWITMPQPVVGTLLPSTLQACIELLRREGPAAPRGGDAADPGSGPDVRAVCREVLALAEAHPGDVGVLATLLLNYVVLQPGEALYLPAGNLHTYLRGTGVEIMANSDNVLRGGLTAKHVDVAELLRVLDFSPGGLSVLRGEPAGPQETAYPTPAREFRLSRLDWAAGESTPVLLHSSWPQILLCTRGSVELHSRGGRSVALRRGRSVWLAAADPDVLICPGDGPVQLFRALPGPATDHEGDLPDL
jgi:mannose-6-phosphate isomerase